MPTGRRIMNRFLSKILKNGTPQPSVGVEADIDTKVTTNKEEQQGTGKVDKIIAKKGAIVNVDNRNVTINLTVNDIPDKTQTPDEYKAFKKELLDLFQKGEIQFVEKQANQDIQGFNASSGKFDYDVEIETLRGIVPPADLLWMQTGLYVRFLNQNGKSDDAKRIKENASRNSQRARNIINLTSAGFLEDYIVPICKKDNKFSKEQYEEIVEEMPSFVFVNSNMSVNETLELVNKKIENKEKYHWEIDHISVNGLNKCIDVLSELKKELGKTRPDLRLEFRENTTTYFRRGELLIWF